MRTERALPRPVRVTSPLDAAEQLQRELGHLGIQSDVHHGYGLALVSVRVGLVVWCDCDRFWWRTGWDTGRKRTLYACHPILEPGQAARRVASRYAAMCQSHRPPGDANGLAQGSKTA